MRVFAVLVERHAPRDLLRRRVDLHRATHAPHRRKHLPGHLPDRPVRGERDMFDPPAAVLDHRFVNPQIQHHGQRPRTIRRGQRVRLPPTRGQAQRRVL